MYEYEVLHIFVPCWRKEGREGARTVMEEEGKKERENKKEKLGGTLILMAVWSLACYIRVSLVTIVDLGSPFLVLSTEK